MKTVGYMLMVYDQHVNYWKPVKTYESNYDAWCSSKATGEYILSRLEDKEAKRPEGRQFKLAEVKIK